MSRIVQMLIASVAVIAMLMLGHSMMSPLPISAATTALGGLAAFWLFRSRPQGAIVGGAMTGAGVGAAIHTFSHVFAGHTHPHVQDAVAAHIVGDVTIGVIVGAVVLALPMLAWKLTDRVVTR
ncbi:MAG: hypothetical protein H6818_05185 [Phycisphaerales bacterium]|nr:hypothetical protein [Phycisphaerales bacterium]MCB9863421.1 hypothetical protein [Phycisphaerales bacterium]